MGFYLLSTLPTINLMLSGTTGILISVGFRRKVILGSLGKKLDQGLSAHTFAIFTNVGWENKRGKYI